MTQLDSTRVLVTGGTSGLGRAMAAALAAAGARVALTSREAARAEAAGAQIGAFGLQLDVRDERSVQAGIDAVYERLGGLDVLVGNAGIGMRTVNPRFMTDPQPFWEVAPAGFGDVLETKVTGTFLVARAVVPRMLAAGGGQDRGHLDERADDDPPRLHRPTGRPAPPWRRSRVSWRRTSPRRR